MGRKSGIEYFEWVPYYHISKEIDGTEKVALIEVFGSAEQAKYYKSECIYLIKNLKIKDIDETIDKFIEYYNNERLQEKIKELTPL